ncbi:ankyrin repeat and SOCS box protein 9-like isoform X3 [Stigmatopora nigra]
MAAVYFSNPLISDVEADWGPVHDAAFHGQMLTVKKLIEKGACVNLVTMNGVSPLHVACVGGHATCAQLLLQHGAHVSRICLFITCVMSEKNPNLFEFNCYHKVDSRSLDGSPIHVAAAKGYPKCIETLAQHCADVDLNLGQSGTPLHVACANRQVNAVKQLLDLGACVNISSLGESPLHVSVRLQHPEMVSLLLDYGADTTLRNSDGKRPPDLAPPGSDVEKLLTQNRGTRI